MQFTPQQLAGAQRYGSKTRIGNWYEDECLEEARFQNFRVKKDHGQLSAGFRREKLDKCLQKVALSFSANGTVRFGDVITLESVETGGALACDPFEETALGTGEFMCTVSPSKEPVARTAFRIVPVPSQKPAGRSSFTAAPGDLSGGGREGDCVRYGEPFCLACDHGLRIDRENAVRRPPLFLASMLKGRKASKISNRQMAYLVKGACSDAVWKFQKIIFGREGSVNRLLASDAGEPVLAGEELVVQHRNTMMNLCTEKRFVDTTDFGAEFELCCHNMCTSGKQFLLAAEQTGAKTAGAAAKAELPPNRWVVRLSRDPEDALDTRELPPEMSQESLLLHAGRAVARGGGAGGLRALRRALEPMYDPRDGKMDREDLRFVLRDFGVAMDEEQFAIMVGPFDRRGDGLVSVNELVGALRGPLAPARQRLIETVYEELEMGCGGRVTGTALEHAFDAAQHPWVSQRITSAAQVLAEFRGFWDVKDPTQTVSRQQFAELHADMAAAFEDDGEFEAMMRGCWGIFGGH